MVDSFVMPNVKKIYPSLLSSGLLSVQPMVTPTNFISHYTIETTRGTNLKLDDELRKVFQDVEQW